MEPTISVPEPTSAPKTGRWQTWQLLVASVVALILGVAIGAAGSGDDDNNINALADETDVAENDDESEEESEVEDEETTTTERETTTTAERKSETGSRSNPLPRGGVAQLSNEDGPKWNLKVLEFTPNANAQVAQENQFNDPPPPGRQFAMVKIEAEYVGTEEPANFFSDLTLESLDASNVAYDGDDRCGSIPDQLDSFGDVYKGGKITGNVCWAVDSARVDSLLMVVKQTFSFDNETFFMALT